MWGEWKEHGGRTHHVGCISRPYRVTCPDGIGLRLEEGNRIVEQIQRVVLYDQDDEVIRESRVCPDCVSTLADGIATGCPSRHLVPKDRSMTLPMPAWENGEGCGGHPKGLTE